MGCLDRATTLRDCYATADPFVFATHTETQGLVLLGSMAAGTAVVALPVMGAAEYVMPGSGAVAAPEDPEGCARVIVDLMRDEERRRAMGREAKVFART